MPKTIGSEAIRMLDAKFSTLNPRNHVRSLAQTSSGRGSLTFSIWT